MKILFSLVCFQIRMPDTLHLFSVFIFLLSPYLPYIRVFCYVSGVFVDLYRKTPF